MDVLLDIQYDMKTNIARVNPMEARQCRTYDRCYTLYTSYSSWLQIVVQPPVLADDQLIELVINPECDE